VMIGMELLGKFTRIVILWKSPGPRIIKSLRSPSLETFVPFGDCANRWPHPCTLMQVRPEYL
jgi:hypothetical protein